MNLFCKCSIKGGSAFSTFKVQGYAFMQTHLLSDCRRNPTGVFLNSQVNTLWWLRSTFPSCFHILRLISHFHLHDRPIDDLIASAASAFCIVSACRVRASRPTCLPIRARLGSVHVQTGGAQTCNSAVIDPQGSLPVNIPRGATVGPAH